MDLVRRVGLSPNVRKKQIPVKGLIFGVPLIELYNKCDNKSGVPNIVYQCANFIRDYGFQEEGLFRVGGNRRVIEQLRTEFDQYGTADLSSVYDVSVVTSVFKMFFRELPEPLIRDQVSQSILLAAEDRTVSPGELISIIRARSRTLPPNNLHLLAYLCSFLHEVGARVGDTKMSDSSLAIVFGPNVFRIKSDLEALQRQPSITKAMSCLITHYQEIFVASEPIYATVCQLSPSSTTTPETGSRGEVATREGRKPGRPEKMSSDPDQTGLIRVESVNASSTQSSSPCFILPETREKNKENIHVNNVSSSKSAAAGSDWDDTWLSGLAQDSPSPETEDILARSHDSLSSMSPLTGSGNLSIQFNLQQTIKECIWEMLVPMPTTSEHSFGIYNNNRAGAPAERAQNGTDKLRRKGPRPEYHSNRNSCVTADNLRTGSLGEVALPDKDSPSPSPPGNRRSSDEMFNFPASQPLDSLTKGRASPQKRRNVGKVRTQSASVSSSGEGIVPKLNLAKLCKNESISSLTTNQSDMSSMPSLNQSPSASPKTSPPSSISSLNSKITLLKQQVAAFDVNFERAHGRAPVGNERRPVASVIKELNELKRLLSDAKAVESSKAKGSLVNQYSAISSKMEEKRKMAGRPNDLKHMTHNQLTEEKLCIQKLLLHFEETYGRPKTKDQKDTMRPVYDRYRKVKVALNARSPGDRECGGGGDQTPTTPRDGGVVCNNTNLGDTWNVTMGTANTNSLNSSGMELVNLSPDQLDAKLAEFAENKRLLRKSLRDYEKAFLNKHGRKVLKEDRGPKEGEYNEYKKLKAKIRLVETILKRNDGSQTI